MKRRWIWRRRATLCGNSPETAARSRCACRARRSGEFSSEQDRSPATGGQPCARGQPTAESEPAALPVQVSTAALDNGIIRVEMDPEDGSFSIRTEGGLRVAGLNRYADGGDGGDTYTWCPPAVDTVIDRPTSVSIQVEEAGPLRGRVAISATYLWPTHADGDEQTCSARSAATEPVTVVTTVSVTTGDPVVAVETTFDNRCRDHRLRAHFPLPAPVTGSDAGCAFAVVRRGLEAEGGLAETPPPTFPARRFVDCSASGVGLAVVADGAFEYEVTDTGRELAVTLLRATGWLSRRRLPLRPDPAGPPLPVEGAQVPGQRRWRYGLLLHSGDWEAAHVSQGADAFLNPLEAVVGSAATTQPTRPPDGQALGSTAPRCRRSSATAAIVAVRLFNPGSGPVSATVGDETVDLRPGQIATVRVGPASCSGIGTRAR